MSPSTRHVPAALPRPWVLRMEWTSLLFLESEVDGMKQESGGLTVGSMCIREKGTFQRAAARGTAGRGGSRNPRRLLRDLGSEGQHVLTLHLWFVGECRVAENRESSGNASEGS